MTIASDLIRGNTDTIILASLMKKDSYGYEINKDISAKPPANTNSKKRRCIRLSSDWKKADSLLLLG